MPKRSPDWRNATDTTDSLRHRPGSDQTTYVRAPRQFTVARLPSPAAGSIARTGQVPIASGRRHPGEQETIPGHNFRVCVNGAPIFPYATFLTGTACSAESSQRSGFCGERGNHNLSYC